MTAPGTDLLVTKLADELEGVMSGAPDGHCVRIDDVDADIEAEVEAVLGRLEALPDLAVTDHVAVFEGVQQRLSEILGNVDET